MVPLHFLRVMGYMLGIMVDCCGVGFVVRHARIRLLFSSATVVAEADCGLGLNMTTPVVSRKPSAARL